VPDGQAGPAHTPSDGRSVRIVLADGDPLARRVVRGVLEDAGIVVVAEATNGRDAVALAAEHAPELVLIDGRLSQIDGITAMRRIIAHRPETRVVMLSVSSDAKQALRSIRAGASGFLTKDMDLLALPRALRGVLRGEVACSRRFVGTMVALLRATPTDAVGMRPVKSVLTPREWEVLDLMCRGASTGQIADRLVLSSETVRSHTTNILRKLAVRTRTQAIERAPQLRALHPRDGDQQHGGSKHGARRRAPHG
jgi:two-component system, NarL family, response regulator LiaR